MKFNRRRNYSDNQKQWGPFLHSSSSYNQYGMMLDSGEPEYPGCNIRFYFFKHTILIELPDFILKPKSFFVDLSKYDWATSKGYIERHPREFGFKIVDGTLHVHYGAQTNDSDSSKNYTKFLPWLNKRFVRYSIYDLNGNHFWTESKNRNFEEREKQREKCPKKLFVFKDFDNEEITATTMIEERQWKFGTGTFKWLSFFVKDTIRRSLNLDFSKEVGPKKGSWKGGITGHGIDLLPDELHEAGFRRYCQQNNLTFIGEIK